MIMNLLCALLLVYLAGFTLAGRLAMDTEECLTENEVYQCGPPCDTQCRYKAGGCHRKMAGCMWRCFCRPGFARDDAGLCIPTWQCPSDTSTPPECAENEEYSKCGSACQATCGEEEEPCSRQCVPGCVCTHGFLRGPDGQCIRPSQCPIKCGPNGVFKACGPPCEETCDTLGMSVQETCPGNYCIAKCFCKPGYVRNSANKCIPPMYCPC